jgi:membrane protein
MPTVQEPSAGSGWWQVIKITAADFSSDGVTQLAAALAYYVLFSIAPLLIVVIAITGQLFGEQAISGELYEQLEGYVGEQGAAFIQEMVKRAHRPGAGIIASIIAIGTLILGATGVMNQLKSSLNSIWDVKTTSGSRFLKLVTDRLLAFGMVLGIGVVLVALVAFNTLISIGKTWTEAWIGWPSATIHWANNLASLVVVAALFAVMFRYLPDVRVGWRHALVGAAVTSVLFTAGKYAFSWYIGRGAIGSAYGAAGSVVVVLLWAYYASLIVFLGAELTQAHARVFGTPTGNRQSGPETIV